jgi:hypothetical protein
MEGADVTWLPEAIGPHDVPKDTRTRRELLEPLDVWKKHADVSLEIGLP